MRSKTPSRGRVGIRLPECAHQLQKLSALRQGHLNVAIDSVFIVRHAHLISPLNLVGSALRYCDSCACPKGKRLS